MSKLANHQTKSQLRNSLRHRRVHLSEHSKQTSSKAICKRLLDQLNLDKVKTLAAYLAQDGEPDLKKFLQACREQSIELYLPRIRPLPPNRLWFAEYSSDKNMETNRYNILEPAFERIIAPSKLDVILLPLVAFNNRGQRLGMGGGFYDRTLAHLRDATKPLLIGIALDEQEVDQIPNDPWDLDIHAIVTPTRWLNFT